MEPSGNRTLRAKYLDWCSARLAERFLDLSPEEIYERSRPAAGDAPEAGPPNGGPVDLPLPTRESYRDLVERVTDSLLVESALPTFEQWADAYRASPRQFDAELLGFWKELVEEDEED
jgi:hypothetical protein